VKSIFVVFSHGLSVPFLGALPGFLPKERLVCVTPKELSMWELADRLMINLAGFHAFLPRVNLVQGIVICSSLRELRAVGNFLGQRVLEGVFGLRIERLLVKELGVRERMESGG
jgi:hypothetical protein